MGRPSRHNQTSSSRAERRAERKERRAKIRNNVQTKSGYGSVVHIGEARGKKIEYLTDRQRILASTILANDATFADGPAGTGKTHIAIAVAVMMVLNGQAKRIVLTKPQFEVDEVLGIEPGDAMEKSARLFKPMLVILRNILGNACVEDWLRNEKIIIEPLGGVVGNTYDDAVIIIDEAQCTTRNQMKAILTRFGARSKMIICGDPQEQGYYDGRDGMSDAMWRFMGADTVGFVTFTEEDIVRSGFCRLAVEAYRKKRPESSFQGLPGPVAQSEPGVLEVI